MTGQQTICALCRLPLQGAAVDRFYCSEHCATSARRHRSEVKRCAFCQQIFARRPHDPRPRFAVQRCCTWRCAGKLARVRLDALGLKPCRGCGLEFGARQGDTRSTFERRRYCSRRCANRTKDSLPRPKVVWAEALPC